MNIEKFVRPGSMFTFVAIGLIILIGFAVHEEISIKQNANYKISAPDTGWIYIKDYQIKNGCLKSDSVAYPIKYKDILLCGTFKIIDMRD